MTAASPVQNVSVEARDVRKRFGRLEVLKGVSFTVNPGEIFVIMGPSGMGKSVLLKHIAGLETPDSGEIFLNCESLETSGVREKYRTSMVFQSAALLTSLTVGENVGLYLTEHSSLKPAEISKIVSQKLEAVGLKGIEDRMPGELSGGMQKRVAIARALVMEPQLVLFDEPTAELDPPMAATIFQEIVRLKTHTHATCIVVTHDRNLAFAIADRIAMFYDGQVAFIGTPAEVQRCADPRVQDFLNVKFSNSKEPIS